MRGQLQIPASVFSITIHMCLCGQRSQSWQDVKEKHLTHRGSNHGFPVLSLITKLTALQSITEFWQKFFSVKSEVCRRCESPGVWTLCRLVNRHRRNIWQDLSLQQYLVCCTEVCSLASGNDCVCSFLLPHSCCHKVNAYVFACLCCGLWMVHFDPREAAVACCHLRNGGWKEWSQAR